MNRQRVAAGLVLAMASAAALPVQVQAGSDFDMRCKVVGIAGIMNVSNTTNQVTRAEFARMLVFASEYRSIVSKNSQVSVFNDVPRNNEYASYIRIAAEQGWQQGYLGGNYRPDDYITLREAARGVLALMGYTNEDFGSNIAEGRMSKFYFLELNDEVNREADEVLNRADCINIFYNLLKAEKKSGAGIYGEILNCELTSDGEINPLTMADHSLKGPKVVTKGKSIYNYVPFDLDDANLFLNGEVTTLTTLKSYLSSSYLVIYYNASAKTVWAYSEGGGDNDLDHCIFRGEVTHIYYKSTDVMTPTAVELNDETGYTFKLESSEIQFAFSVYGSVKVGDTVALICERSSSDENGDTYTVIDYVED